MGSSRECVTIAEIEALYDKYRQDLQRLRAQQTAFYRRAGYHSQSDPPLGQKIGGALRRAKWWVETRTRLKPQLDDLEAEVTYLLLREANPETIVEISPCGGWSTTWILSAMRDNGRGSLYSYDVVDISTRNVPPELAEGRWKFFQGDVATNLSTLPAKIDYLFIDSDHSATFAHWYIATLFPRLTPATPVSVHDVYHTEDPGGFDSEGNVIIDWLGEHDVKYLTVSPQRDRQAFDALMHKKKQIGLAAPIHRSIKNPMIFFRMPDMRG